MGVFEMVVLIVAIGAGTKLGIAQIARSSNTAPTGTQSRILALEAELRSTEERLAQTEDRVADLSEKLVFVENLLLKPGGSPSLPPSER